MDIENIKISHVEYDEHDMEISTKSGLEMKFPIAFKPELFRRKLLTNKKIILVGEHCDDPDIIFEDNYMSLYFPAGTIKLPFDRKVMLNALQNIHYDN